MSLTLRKEETLRVFESRVLLRIFGSNTDEITGKQKRLQDEEV